MHSAERELEQRVPRIPSVSKQSRTLQGTMGYSVGKERAAHTLPPDTGKGYLAGLLRKGLCPLDKSPGSKDVTPKGPAKVTRAIPA